MCDVSGHGRQTDPTVGFGLSLFQGLMLDARSRTQAVIAAYEFGLVRAGSWS
jgi:hypothetical protein